MDTNRAVIPVLDQPATIADRMQELGDVMWSYCHGSRLRAGNGMAEVEPVDCRVVAGIGDAEDMAQETATPGDTVAVGWPTLIPSPVGASLVVSPAVVAASMPPAAETPS